VVHIQIVNFRLEGMSGEDYRGLAEAMAPAFANLPGLVSKTWLADPGTNTYGGVYVWPTAETTARHTRTSRPKVPKLTCSLDPHRAASPWSPVIGILAAVAPIGLWS